MDPSSKVYKEYIKPGDVRVKVVEKKENILRKNKLVMWRYQLLVDEHN